MKKEVYYAVSKKGQGRVFTTFPERDSHWGIWLGESIGCISTLFMLFEADGLEVPNINFNDEPRKYTITIEEVP